MSLMIDIAKVIEAARTSSQSNITIGSPFSVGRRYSFG
jgi:hypothetical protein